MYQESGSYACVRSMLGDIVGDTVHPSTGRHDRIAPCQTLHPCPSIRPFYVGRDSRHARRDLRPGAVPRADPRTDGTDRQVPEAEAALNVTVSELHTN